MIEDIEKYIDDADPETAIDIRRKVVALKKAELFLDLKSHDGFKSLISLYEKRIENIKERLSEDKELNDMMRIALFERKEVYRELLRMFATAEHKVKVIHNQFDSIAL